MAEQEQQPVSVRQLLGQLDRLVYDAQAAAPPGEQQQQQPPSEQQPTGTGAAAAPAATLPLPWEQRALFDRLQSFSSTTWFGKPPPLAPPACAALGWRNTGPDALTCDACGAKVHAKLPANPLAGSGPGIVRAFAAQLTAAHDEACPHRGGGGGGDGGRAIRFPIVPGGRLASAYAERLAGLGRLDQPPSVPAGVVGRIAAAARRLDASLVPALAALLQLPESAVAQQAAGLLPAAAAGVLPRQQAAALLALCGWQVRALLPPHLAGAEVAAAPSTYGVSHLVPRKAGASGSSSSSSAAVLGSPGGGSSSGGDPVSSARAVLQCELCGCRVGLWRFCCSGPFYAAQLSSKAMALVGAAEAATAVAPEQQQQQQQPGSGRPPQAPRPEAASTDVEAAAAAAAATTSIAGGPLPTAGAAGSPGQQQQPSVVAELATPPEAVASSLCHTIAGGSLLAVPATAGFGAATGVGGGPFGRRSSGGGVGTSPGGPFGSAAPAPAFGAGAAAQAAGGAGAGLFGLAVAGTGPASVFEGATTPQPAAGARRSAAASPEQAPVFGLGALRQEEHRAKKRRSSAGAAPAQAPLASSPAPPTGAPAAAQSPSGGGGGGGGHVGASPFSRQPSLLAASPSASRGATPASQQPGGGPRTFDPLLQHRPWCPWANAPSSSSSAGGQPEAATPGIAQALAIGWAATLLALQEQQEQRALAQAAEPAGGGGGAAAAEHLLPGALPAPGQFGTTAAVLARARRVLDELE